MGDMLYEQVVKPRNANRVNFAKSHGKTLMDNYSIFMKQADGQLKFLKNANVYFHAAVQKRESHESPSMEHHRIFVEQTDEQLISWNDDDVDFNADVQKREQRLVQPISGAMDNHFQSMGTEEAEFGVRVPSSGVNA